MERLEAEKALHRVADERWSKVLVTGKTIPWDDARKYLAARRRGEKPVKPVAQKLEHAPKREP